MSEFTTEIAITSSIFEALKVRAEALSEHRQFDHTAAMVANELLTGLLLGQERLAAMEGPPQSDRAEASPQSEAGPESRKTSPFSNSKFGALKSE